MLYNDFCNEFNVCIEKGEYDSANRLILRELGGILADNKSDFVYLLKESGIPASMDNTNIELIDKFVQNTPTNSKLRAGASLLVNQYNQESGFDGQKKINKDNVKNCYRVMTNQYKEDNYSNLAGVGEVVGSLSDLGNTALQGRQKKQGAGLDYAKQRDAQRAELMKSLADKQRKETEQKSKLNKTLMIVGGSLLGLVILGFTFYKLKKK